MIEQIELIGILVTFVTLVTNFRKDFNDLKVQSKRNEFLTHYTLLKLNENYSARDLALLKDVFRQYKALGGNSYVDTLMKDIEKETN